MNANDAYALLLAIFFALGAGAIGCFALMKRMLLASDVLSHLALPGLGLALLFKVNPLLGGAVTLFLGTILVWQLEKKTGLSADATIGVVFAASLAIGAAVTPSEDLVEALFGGFEKLSLPGFLLATGAIVLVALFLIRFRNQLMVMLFLPELAAATGIKVGLLDLHFLLAFSLTILVGLRFMGALLSSALIILPAATARQLTDTMSRFVVVSLLASLSSVLFGVLFSVFVLKTASIGPVTVIISALLFGASSARRFR
jgi:ABC-type Mn2+/Zn2+ transport system permease subunit